MRDISTSGGAFELTASDSKIYEGMGLTSVYVGTTGDVKIETIDGLAVTYKNIPSGGRVLRACTKVYATGTTASDLIGEY